MLRTALDTYPYLVVFDWKRLAKQLRTVIFSTYAWTNFGGSLSCSKRQKQDGKVLIENEDLFLFLVRRERLGRRGKTTDVLQLHSKQKDLIPPRCKKPTDWAPLLSPAAPPTQPPWRSLWEGEGGGRRLPVCRQGAV